MTVGPIGDTLSGMIPQLLHLRTYLDGLHPGLFNATLAAVLFGLLWVVRKVKPLFFAKLPPALQAWPALASGAVLAALSASTDGDFAGAVVNALGMALTGLVSGMLASGIHRTLKESPLPYGSNDVPPKKPPTAAVAMVAVAFGLALSGCSGAKFPDAGTLCALAGDVEPVLEKYADDHGVPLKYVRDAFAIACMDAAKTDPERARAVGLSAAKASASAAAKSGARFDGGTK